jgi:2-methylcitrate dehydratase PrpD
MGLTQDLAAFVARLRYEDIPQVGIDVAKLGFLDCIGVMIAGGAERVAGIVERVVAPDAGLRGEAAILFSDRRCPALTAARINGAAAHALDYDDAGGHRSAILVPAILAEGEALGASGRDMLTAYVAGFEVWSELVRREADPLHEKGWHPTGVYGAVASAAAVAKLRNLAAAECTVAMAIGASQAAGVVANFGTMVKPFHAGASASAGILAARLAAAGMTASAHALEHERGFLAAVSPHGHADGARSAAHLGRDWHIIKDGVSIKKFPTCYCTHRAIDAMLGLLAAHSLAADEIAEICVHIGKTQAAILINHAPRTGLAAKFSIEFAMSCAVLAREVTLRHLIDDYVCRDDVQSLMRKVKVEPIAEYDPTLTSYAPHDWVEILLTSGERLTSARVVRARGHISMPLTRAELLRKFTECLAYGGSDLDAEGAFALIERMETLPANWAAALPRRGAAGAGLVVAAE